MMRMIGASCLLLLRLVLPLLALRLRVFLPVSLTRLLLLVPQLPWGEPSGTFGFMMGTMVYAEERLG